MTKRKEEIALKFERMYQRFYQGSKNVIPFPLMGCEVTEEQVVEILRPVLLIPTETEKEVK